MKKLLLFLAVSLLPLASIAQGVTVEFEVEWREQMIYFDIPPLKPNKVAKIPYLKIIYKNNSGEDVYFRKLSDDGGNRMPEIFGGFVGTFYIPLEEQLDECEYARTHEDYSDEECEVIIGLEDFDLFHNSWSVEKPNSDTTEYRRADSMAGQINEIQEVLRIQSALNKIKPKKQLYCFNYPKKKKISFKEARQAVLKHELKMWKSDENAKTWEFFQSNKVNEKNIETKFVEYFAFLKKHESYTQEHDLTAFFLIGGDYTFLLDEKVKKDYLISLNAAKNPVEYERIHLPKEVNGYKLYEDYFKSAPFRLVINHK